MEYYMKGVLISMSDTKFTPEEEALIKAVVKEQQDKIRVAEIQAEIQNRLMDEQRKKPGYKY
jgi:hypothetical protein